MENQDNNKNISKKEQQEKERQEKIEKILTAINKEGKTLTKVAEEFGYKNSDGVSKLLKRAGYVKKDGIYVLEANESIESNTPETDASDMKKLMELISSMSNRISELEKFSPKQTNGMFVTNEKMDYQNKSVRVDSKILKEFDEFSEKHANINKSYLMSIALREFLDKYRDDE